MKLAVLALPLALATTPALAQDHANHANHAAAAAPAAAAKFTLDTPIETLVADEKAKTVIEANFPGISTHASYDMFKAMSLTQLGGMAPDQVTPEKLAKTKTELAAIK